MEVIVLIAFALTVTGAQESQFEGPENTVSAVGSNVILKCSSPSRNCYGIDWLKYIPGGSPITVFKDRVGIFSAYRDRYSVDNSSGCDLVTKNVQLTDAGRFICSTIISSNTVVKSADLIILKTQPTCKINASLNETVEGDGVQLTCELIYSGTNSASMIWKGEKDAPAAVENGNTISRSNSVYASAPEVPSFTCITSFAAEANVSAIIGLARNIPNTTCETPAIKVLYSARSVNIPPSLAVYSPGTVITCTADGNPAPIVKWQKINATWQDIPNKAHQLFAQCNVEAGQYRCVATNVVRGTLYTAISTEIQILQSDGINSTKTNFSEDCLGGGIGVGIGIGFLISILVASTTFVVTVRLGYLEFHPKPANKPLDGATQQMDQEISPSSRQLSAKYSLVRRTEAPLVGEQESAYASLAQERAANEYEAIQQKEEAKHENSPETQDLSLYSTPREI